MSFQDKLDDIEQWYFQNITPIWVVAAVAALVGVLLFWGGSAVVNAIVDHPLDGCLSTAGYVNRDAPARCFAPVRYTQAATTASTASKPAVKPVYDPPCAAGSDAHGCNDRIYGKSLVEGTVDTVRFYGDEPNFSSDDEANTDRHLVPDYTEVTFLAESDDQQVETLRVCGNQLEHFNPGQRVKRVVKQSTLADYDKCYTLYINFVTFGGKNVAPGHATPKSIVPSSGSIKELPECEHPDGGTCG
jgi:hypothetical protein